MQVLCAHQFTARDFAGKWIQGLKCSFVRGNRARSKAVRKVFCDHPFIFGIFLTNSIHILLGNSQILKLFLQTEPHLRALENYTWFSLCELQRA